MKKKKIPELRLEVVGIDKIKENPDAPRQTKNEESLHGLIKSIKRNGMLIPPTVVEQEDGTYHEHDGSRRIQACRRLGYKEILVCIKPKCKRNKNPNRIQALVVNDKRKGIPALDFSLAVKTIVNEEGCSQKALAKRLVKKEASISQYMKIANMGTDVIDRLSGGRVPWTFTELRELSALKNTDEQLKAIEKRHTKEQLKDSEENCTEKKTATINDDEDTILTKLTKAIDGLEKTLKGKLDKLSDEGRADLRKRLEDILQEFE